MPLYYPKAYCELQIPDFGVDAAHDQVSRGTKTTTLPVRVRSATLELNSHLLADSLHLSCEWRDCGLDPRMIKNATVRFWMGNCKDSEDIKSDKFFRFIGNCTKVKRVQREGEGFTVDCEFLDHTDFFLRMKPFPTEGMPTYADTLRSAWKKICANTGWYDLQSKKLISSVEVLSDQVYLSGGTGDVVIGQAVPERLRKFGKPPIKADNSAWDAWQTCCGMLGLISYINLDKIIVTTTTEHFATKDAPAFIWAENVAEAEESVDTTISGKGIGLTSLDPITGKVLEAFYPPAGDKRINIKQSTAKRKGFDPKELEGDAKHYEMYEYNGCSNQEFLEKKAQAVWEERARQEIQGTIKTYEMDVKTLSGKDFDLLNLRAGDCIKIAIAPDTEENLDAQGDETRQRKYLRNIGYSDDAANLIIKNKASLNSLLSIFHVKQAKFELADDKWEVEITYHNLIDADGNANAKPAPAAEQRNTTDPDAESVTAGTPNLTTTTPEQPHSEADPPVDPENEPV